MAQANKYVPKTQFAADVRANKPGREAVSAGGLDAEFRHIRFSINALCENLALIQRDDGQLQDAAVDVHTLHRDVLMLLGKYELFGTWVPNRPYLQGYVVDYEGKLYVCTESHDANAAMDLSKFKAFGTASGSLTGDYLPVKWDESFFNADADSLTEAGVYVLQEGEAVGFLLVLGVAPNLGQVRVHGEGIGVRFQAAGGWTDWVEAGADAPQTVDEDSDNSRSEGGHSHKVSRASLTARGIVRLSSAIDSDSEEEAATPKAVKKAVAHADAGDAAVRQYVDERILTVGSIENGFQGMPLVADAHVGCVAYFDREEAPPGWLAADGALLKQADYPDLFAVLGRRYSHTADAADTFRLPDGRAEFLCGLDNGRGVDVNRGLGSWAAATTARHYHGTGIKGVGVDHVQVGNQRSGHKGELLTQPRAYDYYAMMQGSWNDGTDANAAAAFPIISDAGGKRPNTTGPRKAGGIVRATGDTTRQTGYHGGTISSLDISADTSGRGGQPRNIALLCCIKVSPPTVITVATPVKAGLVKLHQALNGNEAAEDGVLSSKGVHEAVTAAVNGHKDAATAHSYSQLSGSPDTTSAPVVTDNQAISTSTYGGSAVLLGEPAGWLDFDGKKVPYYN